MRALRDRLGGLDHVRLDLLLSVAIITELELELWFGAGIPNSRRLFTALAAVLFAAPVAVRRRWPGGALVLCSAIAALQAFLGGDLSAANGVLLVPAVLAYSDGAWLDLRRSLAALFLGAGLFGGFVLQSAAAPLSAGTIATDLLFLALLLTAPWFVGRLARERGRRAAAFGELAAQAATEREQRERAAITEERIRIGRELQDIIAHSVSAMVIQAGGARRALASSPQQARESILNVEETGRQTLADLRRLLGMLRRDGDPRALAPQPGLDQLGTLLDSLREAGLECRMRLEGQRIDLTPGIDLLGYRVIEAVLLIVARRRARSAIVTVCYEPQQLGLEIRGAGSPPDLDRDLGAMCERVALYDGSVRRLSADDGRFALRARLPLGTAVDQ